MRYGSGGIWRAEMKRFIEGSDRDQVFLFPDHLTDFVGEDNPVRVVDAFVDALDLRDLGFVGVVPASTGRPGYHPSVLLNICIYCYLNRAHSSHGLEREAVRNVEVMWLTGRLAPDFKTIADFHRDNDEAIRGVCRQFVTLCRQIRLVHDTLVAIDGSKFKAVNNRDKTFTLAKMARSMADTSTQ
jgi:transposase